jgi:hypothetical protein
VPVFRLKQLSDQFYYGDRTMKKMLTLVVILAMASLASAAPIWTSAYNSVTGVVSVSITQNAGSLYIAMGVDPTKGTLSGFAPGPQAPASSANFANIPADIDLGIGTGEIWTMLDTAGVPVYTDGQWLTANFARIGTKAVTIGIQEFFEDGSSVERCSIQLPAIPEPVTMALLGLGGLFLRRRK